MTPLTALVSMAGLLITANLPTEGALSEPDTTDKPQFPKEDIAFLNQLIDAGFVIGEKTTPETLVKDRKSIVLKAVQKDLTVVLGFYPGRDAGSTHLYYCNATVSDQSALITGAGLPLDGVATAITVEESLGDALVSILNLLSKLQGEAVERFGSIIAAYKLRCSSKA